MSSSLYVSGPSLTRRQFWIAAANGAVLWLAAALLLRWLGPMGIHEGSARVILYALVIPGTYPFNLLIRAVACLQKGQMVQALALGTGVATILDGAALAWFPGLYGMGIDMHMGAATVILWGAGVGILLAFWMDR
jgi:hypothetical protein